MNGTALAVGLAAIGLYVTWRIAEKQRTTPTVVVPPPAATPEETLEHLGSVLLKKGLLRTGVAIKEILTGTSGADTFKSYASLDDFNFLKYLMCNAYHQGEGGNTLSTRSARQMAPHLLLYPGHADCNPTNPSPGVVRYIDPTGKTQETTFGSKTLATLWTSA